MEKHSRTRHADRLASLPGVSSAPTFVCFRAKFSSVALNETLFKSFKGLFTREEKQKREEEGGKERNNREEVSGSVGGHGHDSAVWSLPGRNDRVQSN